MKWNIPFGEEMERLEKSLCEQRKRILLLSDIHGNDKALQRLLNPLKPQKNIDFILIAGDIAGTICYPLLLWSIITKWQLSRPLYAKLVYGRARKKFVQFQIKTASRIFEVLKRSETPTAFTFGNTDTPEVIEEMRQLVAAEDNIYFLQAGESVTLSGLHVTAIGGATQQMSNREFKCPHDYTEPQYAHLIDKTKKVLSKYPKEQTILLTHEAPFNTCGDRLLHSNRHAGSKPLYQLDRTMQPLLHVCGHFHESQGACVIERTTVINPGALTHYEYALCEIDPSTTRKVAPKLSGIPKSLGDPVELIYRLNRHLDKAT